MIDDGFKETDFSNYQPIIINVSGPSDNGNYSVTIQTSNEKMIEILGDLSKFENSIKITIGKGFTPDEFFGYIKIRNTKDIEEGLKEFRVSVNRVR